ncbi:recombinase family protein [Mesorhizobium sp. ES1-4]|uniref:recombinase family protein n=1 Tax=Mesorhizobium sp. ES1-4 TaxID=2876627 RepID=UPI001CCF0A8F|nr:recombinase family protein [Mesorhizobium sp. ES1-4]MBZ9797761.1 recombinase family protein [Mesorhizobium sp. ES1-4]
MVINWNQTGGSEARAPRSRIRAAQYVRMSTEHQKYSTDNQASAIQRYADARGFEIVRTYADEGKSGLRLVGRDALQSLLGDIESGRADYAAILVYDVSRWGRFQDPDEAAAIELRCKHAGIRVHYCAEQFENDGSIGSSIVKTVKRAMAGEYSRELSVKVFAGQANLIRLGFRQGGSAGYGLRRVLVDQNHTRKAQLDRGEQKSIATDRVILIPGPEQEVDIVREVYRKFIAENRSELEIAQALNARGVISDLGRPWTRGTVHQLLINEKYIGNNVWGRTSFKLKQSHVQNPDDAWIRADGVFEPIVDKESFIRAQSIIAARSERLSDEAMLGLLGTILARNGYLSGMIIDEAEDCPSSSSYLSRFGSLLRAYALVGFVPDHDYRYLETNRALRRMHPNVVAEVIEGIKAAGGTVEQEPSTDILTVNHEFTTCIVVVRCFHTGAGSLRWKLRLDTALNPDLTVAIRMDPRNAQPRDYYLLPRLDMHTAVLRLCEHNGLSLDAYRFDTLETLYAMSQRTPIEEAA